jgi:metal-sulfur cluster biosynthetic enzyme
MAKQEKLNESAVMEQLKKVEDPEIRQSIVDLGLIYKIRIDKRMVIVDMTFTTPICPLGPMIIADVETKVKSIPGVNGVTVNIVWEPPWTPERMSDQARMALGL